MEGLFPSARAVPWLLEHSHMALGSQSMVQGLLAPVVTAGVLSTISLLFPRAGSLEPSWKEKDLAQGSGSHKVPHLLVNRDLSGV